MHKFFSKYFDVTSTFLTENSLALIFCIILPIISWISYRLCGSDSIINQFINRGIYGRDLNKTDKPRIPESIGVVCGLVYIVTMFCMIPVIFIPWYDGQSKKWTPAGDFPYDRLSSYLSGLLSLTCMLLLGFADDVLDLKWRHKLLLPTIASMPLLMVYSTTYGVTTIVVPFPIRKALNASIGMDIYTVELGLLYYAYMGMLAVFCTNSINILAGINGVEVGQSLVIALSILLNDLFYICPWLNFIPDRNSISDLAIQNHWFSFFTVFPYIGAGFGLWLRNKYPSRVFVGDTFCYFSGMLFAVVGILGKFSKTILLFFIPQVLNFIISLPQLTHLVPCPRHRLPKLNSKTGLLETSIVDISGLKSKAERANRFHRYKLAYMMLKIFYFSGIVALYDLRNAAESSETSSHGYSPRKANELKSNQESHLNQACGLSSATHCSNFTLLNFILRWTGPMHESSLCWVVLSFQVAGSALAFLIRYVLVIYFYP